MKNINDIKSGITTFFDCKIVPNSLVFICPNPIARKNMNIPKRMIPTISKDFNDLTRLLGTEYRAKINMIAKIGILIKDTMFQLKFEIKYPKFGPVRKNKPKNPLIIPRATPLSFFVKLSPMIVVEIG